MLSYGLLITSCCMIKARLYRFLTYLREERSNKEEWGDTWDDGRDCRSRYKEWGWSPHVRISPSIKLCLQLFTSATLLMNLLSLHENVPTAKVLLCLATIYRCINVMVPRCIKHSLDHNCFQICQTRPMDGKVSEPQRVRTRKAPSYTHCHVICSITNEC